MLLQAPGDVGARIGTLTIASLPGGVSGTSTEDAVPEMLLPNATCSIDSSAASGPTRSTTRAKGSPALTANANQGWRRDIDRSLRASASPLPYLGAIGRLSRRCRSTSRMLRRFSCSVSERPRPARYWPWPSIVTTNVDRLRSERYRSPRAPEPAFENLVGDGGAAGAAAERSPAGRA
jgi:hypothetical protein